MIPIHVEAGCWFISIVLVLAGGYIMSEHDNWKGILVGIMGVVIMGLLVAMAP